MYANNLIIIMTINRNKYYRKIFGIPYPVQKLNFVQFIVSVY